MTRVDASALQSFGRALTKAKTERIADDLVRHGWVLVDTQTFRDPRTGKRLLLLDALEVQRERSDT
jgi:hypothetical protein